VKVHTRRVAVVVLEVAAGGVADGGGLELLVGSMQPRLSKRTRTTAWLLGWLTDCSDRVVSVGTVTRPDTPSFSTAR